MLLYITFCVEKLLFRNIQPAPPTLSLRSGGSDVILLDTKLVPCCISPSVAATGPPVNSGDVCAAKPTGNSLMVGSGDTGNADCRLETGSSASDSDRPTGYHRRYYYDTTPHSAMKVACSCCSSI